VSLKHERKVKKLKKYISKKRKVNVIWPVIKKSISKKRKVNVIRPVINKIISKKRKVNVIRPVKNCTCRSLPIDKKNHLAKKLF
jgi:transcriptional regulator CtsR